MYQKKRVIVSVPFPGILFLNKWKWFWLWKWRSKFPSPSRGSYFSIIKPNTYNSIKPVSVPFPGILFLNTNIERRCHSLKNGFRPLPGDLISQCVKMVALWKKLHSFRPLPGDLISQYENGMTLYFYAGLFPSPSRGSYFSMKLPNAFYLQFEHVSVPFPGILFLNPVLYMPDLNWIPKPNCGAKPNPTLE